MGVSVYPVGRKYRCEVRLRIDKRPYSDSKNFDSKMAARLWGAQRESELRAEARGGFPPCSVRQLLEKWRDEVAPARGGGRWDVNRINATVGRLDSMGLVDMQLADFGPKQMAALRRARLAEISPVSAAREEALLKTIWRAARHPDWSLTDVDPFLNLGGIKGSGGVPRKRRASWQELRRVLRELGYHPRRPEVTKKAQTGLAMLVALRTTLRSQEVLQLADGSVDLTRMVVRIDQHKTRWLTKEAKSVPLMPKAVVLLARKCLGRGAFFTLSPGSRDKLYRDAKILAGVPDLTFHDLKRTAVLALKQHLTENELLSITGNSSVEILRRHYMTDTAAEASKVIWKSLGASPADLLKNVGVRR